jgi:small-conductance mechanosensitive channel
METMDGWLNRVRAMLEAPLIGTGDSAISLWSILYLVVFLIVLFWSARRLQRWLAERVLLRTGMDIGARQAAGTIARYVLLLVGLLVLVQTAGIDLTTFNVLAGAIGIGVGFGLQNVVSNFIAGLIIMFERPIKIGDRIVVDNVDGDVIEIGARSTTVLTNDNITIIVPNSRFITESVVNWQYEDKKVRFKIPVAVAYGSDASKVRDLLLQVASADPEVLEVPEPTVRLLEFGDNGLHFELRAWSSTSVHRRGRLLSSLNFAIYETFNAAGIEFPFPQRDLHIKSGVLQLRQGDGAAAVARPAEGN